MAEGSAPSTSESEVASALKSLQEQLREQQKVQASILQQLSAVQQTSLQANSVGSGLPPAGQEAVSGEYNFLHKHPHNLYILGSLYIFHCINFNLVH